MEKAIMTREETNQPQLTMKKGKTTFLIGIHFSEKAKESFEDKIKGMMMRDVRTENF